MSLKGEQTPCRTLRNKNGKNKPFLYKNGLTKNKPFLCLYNSNILDSCQPHRTRSTHASIKLGWDAGIVFLPLSFYACLFLSAIHCTGQTYPSLWWFCPHQSGVLLSALGTNFHGCWCWHTDWVVGGCKDLFDRLKVVLWMRSTSGCLMTRRGSIASVLTVCCDPAVWRTWDITAHRIFIRGEWRSGIFSVVYGIP